MTQVSRALVIANVCHRKQVRKYTGDSYIVHPIEVMGILLDHGINDDDVLAAAILHDSIEDTWVTPKFLLDNGINERVVSLVLEVTDVSKPEDGNRAARKALDCAHLAEASVDGQNIKLADLISNTASIVKHDSNFAKVYLAEKEDLLQVLIKGNWTLRNSAARSVEDGLRMIGTDDE